MLQKKTLFKPVDMPVPEIRRVDVPPPNVDASSTGYDSSDTLYHDPSCGSDDDFSDTAADKVCDELQYETRKCRGCDKLFDWNNAFSPEQPQQKFCNACEKKQKARLTCVECGKQLTTNNAYPKSNQEWAEVEKTWCGKCFKHFVVNEMIPKENERRNTNERQNNRKRKGENQESAENKKRPCGRCGAMTHKTVRSRLCPFNVKYKNLGEGLLFFNLPHIPHTYHSRTYLTLTLYALFPVQVVTRKPLTLSSNLPVWVMTTNLLL